MELSKLSNIYMKLCEKYPLDLIDTDKDMKITQDEVLTMAYKDEELRAELDDSDLELIKDCISADENDKSSSAKKSGKSSGSSGSTEISQLKRLLSSLFKSSSSTNTELLSLLLYALTSATSDKSANNTESGSGKKNYECLKTVYKDYLKNEKTVKEKSLNGEYSSTISSQLTRSGKQTEIPLSTQYWNGEKENAKWSNIKIKELVDINGDGKVSFDDLKSIPQEFDLDNDGKVSTEEKTFLNKLKIRLYNQLKNELSVSLIKNINSIDDIISYLDIKENDELISKTIKGADSWLKSQGAENSGKQFVNENSGCWSTYGISAQSLQSSTVIEEKYKNLIMKTDLTKAQLTEILNKINSASSSVRAQLSEIKTVIETKLGAMS